MLALVTDQNFDEGIVCGLLRRLPELDLMSVRDEGMEEAEDPDLLSWAAAHGRLVLTHDHQTMPGYAYDRVARGLAMPGVFRVSDAMPSGSAIEELLSAIQCSFEGEFEGQVIFFPLRSSARPDLNNG